MEDTLHTSILILHVLGAAIIIGVAFVTLVIELKKYTSKEILVFTEYIWQIAGIALGIQLLTGFYLAGSEWDEISSIPYFWVKMILFFVIGGVVGIVNKSRFEKMKKGLEVKGGTRWAWIAFLTFAIIAALGVLIVESASEASI